MLRHEAERFFTALAYFSRLPIPSWVGFDPGLLASAARYFPLVGLLLGALVAAVLWATLAFFTPAVAVLLTMAFGLLLTGAFHEDGLADSADGLGGGMDRESALRIMKDSRLGTYGALALGLALALKASLWLALLDGYGAVTAALMIALAQALSRWPPVELMRHLPYVREPDQARAKPVAEGLSAFDLALARLTAMVALAALVGLATPLRAFVLLALLLALAGLAARYLMQRLGGLTGDTLGAVQQLAELSIYLTLVATSPA